MWLFKILLKLSHKTTPTTSEWLEKITDAKKQTNYSNGNNEDSGYWSEKRCCNCLLTQVYKYLKGFLEDVVMGFNYFPPCWWWISEKSKFKEVLDFSQPLSMKIKLFHNFHWTPTIRTFFGIPGTLFFLVIFDHG